MYNNNDDDDKKNQAKLSDIDLNVDYRGNRQTFNTSKHLGQPYSVLWSKR